MSADGASFVFNSVDYGTAYGVYVVDRNWPRMPRPRLNLENYAQADGCASQGETFEPRRITMRCVLVAADETARNTAAGNMAGGLAACHRIGLCELIFDHFSSLAFWARIASPLDVELAANGEIFTLEWVCPDPWPHATSSTTSSANAITSGTPLSLTPGGTAPTNARYTFRDGGSGAASVVLTNAATGDTATWANALPAGAWLRLDSAAQTFEVSTNSGGAWTSIPSNSTGIIPQLSGGIANALTITGPGGTLDVTYTARYLQ